MHSEFNESGGNPTDPYQRTASNLVAVNVSWELATHLVRALLMNMQGTRGKPR